MSGGDRGRGQGGGEKKEDIAVENIREQRSVVFLPASRLESLACSRHNSTPPPRKKPHHGTSHTGSVVPVQLRSLPRSMR